MEIVIKKSSNVYLYKLALEEFIKKNYRNETEIKDIDYIVGIMFLTELNRYCKINKLQIHGYYIAYVIIILFRNLRLKLMFNIQIKTEIIYDIIEGINENIVYINSRVNDKNDYKKKINENISGMMLEFIPKIKNIIKYNNKEHNKENNKENIYCKDKCYICWLDNGLCQIFYILFMMAKYIGSGVYKDVSMIKISEYFGEMFYIILNINNIEENEKMRIYEKYMIIKTKINEYFIENAMNSKTLDEILLIIEKMIFIKICK
jgi:hypothetical protein